MFFIVHGDDSSASRQHASIIVGSRTPITLDGKNISFSQLVDHLQSTDLFGSEKIIVLENFLSKNKKKKEIIKSIQSTTLDIDIIFLEETKLPPTSLNLLKGAEVKAFLLPQFYFQLLDSFAPGNAQYLFGLYHQVLNTTAPELVFYSLIKRMRQLIILHRHELKDSKETAALQSWQIEKLKKQLAKWKKENLFLVYQILHETELKLKSGGLPIGLSKQLDIVILTHLR